MSMTDRFYDILKKKLNEPLPSASQFPSSGNAEAMGMVSAQAGPVGGVACAATESSDNANEDLGIKKEFMRISEYSNAAHNITNFSNEIAEIKSKINDDMDANERKKILAKLAEKQEYMKILRARLRLADAQAREEIAHELDKEAGVISEAGAISREIDAKRQTHAINKSEKVYRKNSEYRNIADKRNKILEEIYKTDLLMFQYLKRGEYSKSADLRVKSENLKSELRPLADKINQLQRSMQTTLPKSYWESTIHKCEKIEDTLVKQIEDINKALTSINATRNPEVKEEYQYYLKSVQFALSEIRKTIESSKKMISAQVKTENTFDNSDGEQVLQEANIFQRVAIKADGMVDKIALRDYRKDANYRSIDNNMRKLKEKISEMDIDIERLELKSQDSKAESLRAQQQRLVNQYDKLSLQETELRSKVEDAFPKSYWRKEMEGQRKVIEKLQGRVDKTQRRLEFFKRQSERGIDDGGLIDFYTKILKEREDNVKMAASLYDAMQRKYDSADEK